MNKSKFDVKYPEHISKLRYPKPVPKSAVIDGKSQFGTYIEPFEKVNLLDTYKPLGRKHSKLFTKSRLKEWEGFEVDFEDVFMVGAIYDIGVNVFNVVIIYDKKTGEIHDKRCTTRPKKILADNLLDSRNYMKVRNFEIEIINKFKSGECEVNLEVKSKKKPIKAHIKMKSISTPSVVNLPFAENRPLYTHKELFKAEGYITVGDKTWKSTEKSLAIIDDHKGFYPHDMHYDWITAFKIAENGDVLSFTLTDNQVINPTDYNENYLWLNGEMLPLPLMKVKRLENGNWHAQDENGLIDLTFEIDKSYKVLMNALVAKIKYIAPFGYFKGYITDHDGVKHNFDGAFGMGEDKNYFV